MANDITVCDKTIQGLRAQLTLVKAMIMSTLL